MPGNNSYGPLHASQIQRNMTLHQAGELLSRSKGTAPTPAPAIWFLLLAQTSTGIPPVLRRCAADGAILIVAELEPLFTVRLGIGAVFLHRVGLGTLRHRR